MLHLLQVGFCRLTYMLDKLALKLPLPLQTNLRSQLYIILVATCHQLMIRAPEEFKAGAR
jgi:hypothetical protein